MVMVLLSFLVGAQQTSDRFGQRPGLLAMVSLVLKSMFVKRSTMVGMAWLLEHPQSNPSQNPQSVFRPPARDANGCSFYLQWGKACVWVAAYVEACGGCGAPIPRLHRRGLGCRCIDVKH